MAHDPAQTLGTAFQRLGRSGNAFAARRAIEAFRIAEKLNRHMQAFVVSVGALGPHLTHRSTAGGSPDKTPSRFEARTYSGPEGSMDYWLYVPAGNLRGLPALIMLHGCMQSPCSFARGTRMNELAEDAGINVAYLRQSFTSNLHRCWNWFKSENQQRGSGDAALIAAVTQAIVEENDADSGRVYIAGFSAGGATAAIMGATYPDVYAAIGIHSGLDVGSANSNLTAMQAMRIGGPSNAPSSTKPLVPIITFHGDCDRTINAINSTQIVEAAAQRSTEPLSVWTETGFSRGCRPFSRKLSHAASRHQVIEQWTVHGAGHAWSGGRGTGSFTDPLGPDASRAMLEFFLRHRLAQTPVMPCAAPVDRRGSGVRGEPECSH